VTAEGQQQWLGGGPLGALRIAGRWMRVWEAGITGPVADTQEGSRRRAPRWGGATAGHVVAPRTPDARALMHAW
jgi:hypothetical protein